MGSLLSFPRFVRRCRITTVWTAILGVMLAGHGSLRAEDATPTPAPAASPNAIELTTLFNTAVTSFDRGEYQKAVTAIETLVKQLPGDLPPPEKAKLTAQLEPIYYTLGAAYFNLKQYPQAVTAIKDYLARYPKSARLAEATFALAQASYFAQDYPAAAKGFASLENTPNLRERALLFEGLSYREANDDAKAIAALEKLTAPGITSPTAARGAMQLLFLYSRQKQPDKALKMLSAVQENIAQLENVVELNTVALQQGDTYLEENANPQALICYRAVRTREQIIALERDRIADLQRQLEVNKNAIRANPKDAPQYFIANRQLQDSVAEDQQLLANFEKLPPTYAKVLYRIGRALYQMNRPWEAIVAYGDSYDRTQDPADREAALFGTITAYVDVNEAATARTICNKYLKEFPKGTNADTVGYLLGATALQENDPKAAEMYFGRMLTEQPTSAMREEMSFLLANAQLAQGKYDDAIASYARYQKDFASGLHTEEAVYRTALATLFAGKYDDALKAIDGYFKQYPKGNFASDMNYRRLVCLYAKNEYDTVIADTQKWLKQYPGDSQQGEVESLLGDAYGATGRSDDALAAYQASYRTAATVEVLNYSLGEAGKILQKRGDWAADDAMFADFVKAHPDHPSVVMALSQVGRAKVKLGKIDEAKKFFADTLKRYIDDRDRDSVEQIIDQLAMLCVRRKPAAAAVAAAAASPTPAPDGAAPAVPAATPEPTPAADPGAELDTLLGATLADRAPTAQARILYAKAVLARLRRQPDEAERGLLEIAARFKPDVLSAVILGQVGDALLAKGRFAEAAPLYQALLDGFPKNDHVDFAYAGLGEIAFQKKQYEQALQFFRDGTDKIAANQKLKDVTVGQGKALLALGRLDEARKIFEQAASVKEWRGETTAFCVYSLGQIESKQGHWAEANAYYQRVYVAVSEVSALGGQGVPRQRGEPAKTRQDAGRRADVSGNVAQPEAGGFRRNCRGAAAAANARRELGTLGLSRPMNRFSKFPVARCVLPALAAVAGWIGLAVSAHAQTITMTLRDGQTIQAQGLRRDGATVLARVQVAAGNVGEAGYPAASIARIDFPEPPQLKGAADLLGAGKAGEAATQLGGAVAYYYAPFRDVPGNWWAPLAVLQLDALIHSGRNREADALLAELGRFPGLAPDIARAVKIKQAAALERRGEHQQAIAALEPLVKDPAAAPDETVEGWLAIGSARLALRQYKEALLAFLHTPVYTPNRVLLMPPALLGSAKAYAGIEDDRRAQTALNELLATYPNSSEAAEAKDLLQKLQSRRPKPANG